jgi:hypothetical protein
LAEGRDFQGQKPLDALALRSKRLAAGCQDMHTRSAMEHLLRQGSGGIDHALAAVQHQEHLLVFEIRKQSWKGVV